jgi:transcriptional regulator with XRE-family HTH domain
MTKQESLINNIKLLRLSNNMTEPRLAQRLRITVGEYRLIEQGIKELSANQFIELARFYSVTLNELTSERLSSILTKRIERMERTLEYSRRVNHNEDSKEILKQIRNANKIEKFNSEPNQNFY